MECDRIGERDDRLFLAEVVGLRRRLHLLQRGLLLRVGRERILVGLVGGVPQRGAERDGIVVESGQFERSVAAAAGAVGLVVAHAHRDARNALVCVLRAFAGAELRLGVEVVDFFNAVLDEERLGKALQLQLAHAAVELGEHGLEHGIFFGVGAGVRARCRA